MIDAPLTAHVIWLLTKPEPGPKSSPHRCHSCPRRLQIRMLTGYTTNELLLLPRGVENLGRKSRINHFEVKSTNGENG